MKLQRIVVCVEPYAELDESCACRQITKFSVRSKIEMSGEKTECVFHHAATEVEMHTTDFDMVLDYMLKKAGDQIKDIIKRKQTP